MSSDQLDNLLNSMGLTGVDTLFKTSRSCVMEVVDRSGKHYIVKIRPTSSNKSLFKEAKNLKILSHPNIVELEKYVSDRHFSILQTEKINGKAIVDILTSRGPLSEEEVKNIYKQVISALIFMKSYKISHLDIKPDNIIYDPISKVAKVIDFETASKKSFNWLKKTNKVGTYRYQSPEIEKGKYKGPEADVWSLGVSIFVSLFGYYPQISKKTNEFNFPPNASSQFKNLISSMLERDPKARATLEDVQNHPWFYDAQEKNSAQRSVSN